MMLVGCGCISADQVVNYAVISCFHSISIKISSNLNYAISFTVWNYVLAKVLTLLAVCSGMGLVLVLHK